MSNSFGKTLRKLRMVRGLSQAQLAESLFVTRSAVAKWESGSRLPDADMIARLAGQLEVRVGLLMGAAAQTDGEKPCVILVDDKRLILNGGLPVLEAVLPEADVLGFTKPSEALALARSRQIDLAFLDIDMGRTSGLDLCRELLKINERTNVVFLTAYMEYAYDAWSTGASGFILKPITPEAVRGQLKSLRHPFFGGGG